MRSAARSTGCPKTRVPGGLRGLAPVLAWLFAVWLAVFAPAALAQTGNAELAGFTVQRGDDGLILNYAVNFELPRGAEEALAKSVPLYFVAEAEVFRDRWYWRDKRIASAARVWRIVYQPLTANYRVTFAGISQSYTTRTEAFAAIRRGVNWKVADLAQLEDGSRHYVEFSFRLDTSLLPRPMQIGIATQSDWALTVERMQRFD